MNLILSVEQPRQTELCENQSDKDNLEQGLSLGGEVNSKRISSETKLSAEMPSMSYPQDELDSRLSLAITKSHSEAKHKLRMNDLRVASPKCLENLIN